MSGLTGKAVVITGSGRGNGAACARRAARQGAAVVVNDMDAEPAAETVAAIKADGGTAIACVADITDWGEAGRLIQSCIDAFGKIDGLVNNAALFHGAGVEAIDPEAVRNLVDVNVLGPLHCTGHAIKPMLAQKSGSIVNVVSGAHMGMLGMGIYGATKGAVASMVYTWAL
ncbi:MAG: SDR family NAD(P)-dependent oxidoreductase, partial [Bradyrhizobium sp.]